MARAAIADSGKSIKKTKPKQKTELVEVAANHLSESPDSHILDLLQKESNSARRVILLIPCFQDETQEEFRRYMRLRSIESFFMECHSWAVSKRRSELPQKAKNSKEISESLAYRMAQVWEILHKGWPQWYDQVSDPSLSDEDLMLLLERAPFTLAYERYPLLTQTHYLDAVAYAPDSDVETQLKLAVDSHLNSHHFRNHLKETYSQSSKPEKANGKPDSRQLELLQQELKIVKEEKKEIEEQNDKLIIRLHELEHPKPVVDQQIPFSREITRLHEAYLAWECQVLNAAASGSAEAILNTQDAISDILCEFIESIKMKVASE